MYVDAYHFAYLHACMYLKMHKDFLRVVLYIMEGVALTWGPLSPKVKPDGSCGSIVEA